MKKHILRSICLCAFLTLAVLLVLAVPLLLVPRSTLPSGARAEWDRTFLGILPWTVILLLLLVGLILLLARGMSRRILKPLEQIHPDHPVTSPTYPELEPLLEQIRRQKEKMRQQSDELLRRATEFEAATNRMSEGLVLMNADGVILTVNRAAMKLLGIEAACIGMRLSEACPSPEIPALLQRAQNGEHAEASLPLEGQDYRIYVSPTLTEGRVEGLTLLIFDITEKEKAEKLRREFTANVSHELKTPLHTISGCAELLSGGMVKAEDVPGFSEKIYTEARRMITLVDDIIKLSRLDEGADDALREAVDLYALAAATVQSLSPLAEGADVRLSLQGSSVSLFAVRQFVSIIIYNLCDNAIKYNREGGSVTVTVSQTPEYALLTVRDTGIGIPAEEQERIFERFYRVDKSHSKALGGTGLGLSIVKHAAKLHNATVKLNSIPDKGTTVTVYFPK